MNFLPLIPREVGFTYFTYKGVSSCNNVYVWGSHLEIENTELVVYFGHCFPNGNFKADCHGECFTPSLSTQTQMSAQKKNQEPVSRVEFKRNEWLGCLAQSDELMSIGWK